MHLIGFALACAGAILTGLLLMNALASFAMGYSRTNSLLRLEAALLSLAATALLALWVYAPLP
jgi:hypothetical protein